jgi:hypothetical protein
MFEKITVGPAAWDSSVMIPIDAAATAAAKIRVADNSERARIFKTLSRMRRRTLCCVARVNCS